MEKLAGIGANEAMIPAMENRNPIVGNTYMNEYARLGLIILSDIAKLPPSIETATAAATLINAYAQL